jgi:AAHS family 4-hydroxybenzoate transporter-like MFS transporter
MRGEGGPPSAIGEALDRGAWGGFQIAVLVLASIAFIVEGLTNQLISLSIPALMKAWNLPREPFATALAMGLIGVAAGNALGGLIGDRIGRRRGIIGSIVVIGVMDLAASMVGDVVGLSLVRLVAGLGLGALIPNCATLIAEFTPQRRRAFAVSFGLLFIPLGIVLAGFVASLVLPNYGWPALFQVGGALPLLIAAFFVFVLPESPRYLARDPTKRAQVMKLMRRMNLPLPEDSDISEARATGRRSGVSALFTGEMRRDTFCLWGYAFFAYMTSYIILNWAPGMLAGQGLSLAVTSRSLSAWSLGGFGSPLIGLAIQRWGSRRALGGFALAAGAGTLALMALPLNEDEIIYLMTMLFVENLFVVGLLGAVYVVATHIYPPSVRSTGTGAASALGRLGAMTSAYTGVYSLHLGGSVGYFACMTATSLITFAFTMAIHNHVPKAMGGSAPIRSKSELKAAE